MRGIVFGQEGKSMEVVFKTGDIVESRAGRDAKRSFVVTATEDNYVWLSDGDLRKVDKPKKKKIKHIKLTGEHSEFIAGKAKPTNSEIRRALQGKED